MAYLIVEDAYMYEEGKKTPIAGDILHDQEPAAGVQWLGWFVPKGFPFEDGSEVRDEEGKVNHNGKVWFKHKVHEDELEKAYRQYYERVIYEKKHELEYLIENAKELGIKSNEEET